MHVLYLTIPHKTTSDRTIPVIPETLFVPARLSVYSTSKQTIAVDDCRTNRIHAFVTFRCFINDDEFKNRL